MGAIQAIFRQYAPAYLERFGDAVCAAHLKVIEALGSVCYQCEDCGHPQGVPAALRYRRAATATALSASTARHACGAPGLWSALRSLFPGH
jgi:hypothetical protein